MWIVTCILLLLAGNGRAFWIPHHQILPFTRLGSTSLETILELDPHQVLKSDTLHNIQQLVDQRGEARWEGNYPQADTLKEQILQVSLPQGVVLSLEDIPRTKGGGSHWKLHYQVATTTSREKKLSVLQLAHAALGLAVSCSQTMTPLQEKQQQLDRLVHQAKTLLRQWKSIHEQRNLTIMESSANSPRLSNNPHLEQENSQAWQSIFVHKLHHDNDDNDADYITGWSTVETTLRGRKAADAVFWFAMAGVSDAELYDLLSDVCIKELRRFGTKPTCRAKDILQIMDRFAASGVHSSASRQLEHVAKECLQTKDDEGEPDELLLDLHSDRCLLLLWKFSSRQKKQQFFLQLARKHWETQQSDPEHVTRDTLHGGLSPMLERNVPETSKEDDTVVWDERFADPTRPLVIDVGCGMGLSLLGLASLGQADGIDPTIQSNVECDSLPAVLYDDCNFLGVDLSGLTIGYAQGIAERWGLGDRLHWEVDSAEALLQCVIDSYPGPVLLCLIQFPTPYRLPTTQSGGNAQLPTSALDGFMASPSLLKLIHQVLSKECTTHGKHGVGHLILQSNCEDVALWMHDAATTECGFQAMPMLHPVQAAKTDDLPQRTQNWIDMGGARAVGSTWSAVPLLPRKGSTETEVACRINRTPIHRCVLTPRLEL
ncbi:tRNA (guanine-N(7)-)-methyltransferase-like [Seminavis robusta]|uniref:tRNA (guanine(46)-N(7))-methyltransferase n=1 Tax=Seminavis robusta TaxID=568900 RepID=A0A9N8E0U2_9STRA|nr:tRNA (guanine-N(7)-)-methyltransferase-like [Seminavis robusta]|eukprot:Sro395_g134020.1 tRNA (guanine-N(7)-)-methyltransferase-like (658) ;mRNA; r:18934-20907